MQQLIQLDFSVPFTRIVVNEASLKETNIEPEKALGTKLHVELNGQHLKFEIVGVVAGFPPILHAQELSPNDVHYSKA